jgi:hypothetical protein
MDKMKLAKHSASLIQLVLNDKGDYTAISPNDSTLFDRFVVFCKWLVEQSDSIPKQFDEIEKKYTGKDDIDSQIAMTTEMSRINVAFSNEAVKMADSIFGEGTIRKYFRNIYDEIPDFLPDADCFFDFVEEVTPKMEEIFNRKVDEQKKKNREKMAKYQPQDHKRKQ